jgi:hypothetical protein
LCTLYIQKKSLKNDHATQKFPDIVSVKASFFLWCTEDPPNLYKIGSAKESDKWWFNVWLKNMVFRENIEIILKTNTLYEKKDSHEYIVWDRGLVLIGCKVNLQNKYKNEFAT